MRGRRREPGLVGSCARRTFWWCALLVGGCAPLPYGQVSGRITLEGQPLPDVQVVFSPAEGGRSAIGKTDEQGRYELAYTPGARGAKIGPNRVTLSTFVAPTLDDNNRVIDPGSAEMIPRQYGEKSDVVVDVQPGRNTFDFDLQPDSPNESRRNR